MYAGSTLDSDYDKEVILRLSSDDWLSLWVNGKKRETWQNEGRFETVRIPLKLKRGRNEFLLKTNNLGHHWNSWVSNFVLEEPV
jgi:hypothetical protein